MDYLASLFIFSGSFFMLIAGIGILRMPNLFMQMHAATKASVLGCGLILLGVGIEINDIHSITEIIVLIFFIALTNPLAAHLVAKAAFKNQE